MCNYGVLQKVENYDAWYNIFLEKKQRLVRDQKQYLIENSCIVVDSHWRIINNLDPEDKFEWTKSQ